MLVLCMVLPLLPVFATDGTEPETVSNIRTIIDHDFDDDADLAAWEKGPVKNETKTVFSLDRVTLEDDDNTTALALSASKISTDHYVGTNPTAYLDIVENIEFTAGNKIIIEMKLKQTGDDNGYGWTYLKYNRPNTVDIATSYVDGKDEEGNDKIVDAGQGLASENAQNWWTMFGIQKEATVNCLTYNNKDSSIKNLVNFEDDVDTTTNWTDVLIVIDEQNKKYSVATKTGDVTGFANDGTIRANKWELQNFDSSAVLAYDSLDSLTLFMRNYAQTLYVDYFRVYEVTPAYADAQILGGKTVEAGKTADIQFINVYSDAEKTEKATIGRIPEDSITIKDKDGNVLDVIQEYDATNQIISVKPDGGFVKGETYTITPDKTQLATMSINYTGTESFTVRARGERTNGVGLYDTFANGTDGWEIGKSVEGYEAALSQASATEGDENYDAAVVGATDGKALKVTFKDKKTGSSSQSVVSNITKAVGNGIKFNNDNSVIIKTRIKKTADIDYQLRLNRPDTIEQLKNEEQWLNYFILQNTQTTGLAVMRGINKDSWSALCYPSADRIDGISNIDYKNKWVTYTLEFKPAEGKYYTTVTYTGDDGNEVDVLTNNSLGMMQAQKNAYEKEYGEGSFGDSLTGQYYDALERLTFAGYFAGNIYIDYVKVYEKVETKAVMQGGRTVDKDGSFSLKFINTGYKNSEEEFVEGKLDLIPEGAVTVEGVIVTESFDNETQTLTLTPTTPLTEGTTYKVTVNTDVLADAGIEYKGTPEFNVRARGARDTGLVVNDTFETVSDKDNWVIGDAKEGYQAVTNIVDVPGEEGNKALSVTMKANDKAAGGAVRQVPNIVRKVGNGIEFNDETSVVIKARVMVKSAKNDENGAAPSTEFHLRMNASDYSKNIDFDHIKGWSTYSIMSMGTGGVIHPIGIGYENPSNHKWYFDSIPVANTGNSAILDKWVDYTITLDGINNTTTINAVCDSISLNEITKTSTIGVSRDALINEYGTGTTKTYFDALDTISFVLFDTANTNSEMLVDYVKVNEYATYEIFAKMPAGNTVKYDEAIKLVFSGEDEIPEIPAGAVKINGIVAKQEYEASTKTLSVKLADNAAFTKGETYTVTIDASALATVGMNYVGTTNFKVRARDDFQTGLVINDQFDSNTNGWTEGAVANEAMEATVEWKENYGGSDGVLHFKGAPVSGTYGYEDISSVTKLIGEGVEIKENMPITIKTKIMQITDGGSMDLKLNRPDVVPTELEEHSFTFNHYTIMKYQDDAKQLKFSTISSNNSGVSVDKAAHYVNLNPFNIKETPLVNQVVDALNKWVVYTITINPGEWDLAIKAEILDENGNVASTYSTHTGNPSTIRTAFRAYENVYGRDPDYTTQAHYADSEKKAVMDAMSKWISLDRLTFASTSKSVGNEFYIDYITVEQNAMDRTGIPALKVNNDATSTLSIGDVVTPEYMLSSNAKYAQFTVVSAMYIDGKLAETHYNKIKPADWGEFTYTDAKSFKVPATNNRVEIKAFVWDENMVPLCEVVSAVKEEDLFTVYVETLENGGNDTNTGTAAAPVASLNRALDIVYSATDEGIEKAEIVIGEGNYKVDDTILIPNEAKIPANGLVIKNKTNNKPVFVGGNTYTGADMIKVTADNDTHGILSKVPTLAQNNIYMIKLDDIETIPGVSYPGPTEYRVDKIVKGVGLETDATLTDVTLDASFDGKLMTIARWPNLEADGGNNYATATSAYTDFAAYDLINSYKNVAAVEALDDATKATIKTNIQKGITVGVPEKDISKWADAVNEAATSPENTPLMFGYWGHDWATQTMPVGNVDSVNKTITSKYASTYKAQDNARFYVYNLLCELDTDGEYYIDRVNKVMYFCKDKAPTESSKVTISTLDSSKPMLEIKPKANITVDGLVFENSRGSGIALLDADGAVVQNCEIRNVASYGLLVFGRNNKVQNNYIHDTNGGISIGSSDNNNDIKNLNRANNIIHGNEIENFSRLNKVYTDAILIEGVGNTISYNKIHGGEHLAVRLTGHLNTFKNNEIYDVLNEVDDAGAIYVGRRWSQRGNKILSNYIHDLAIDNNEIGVSDSPVAGIFVDDHYAGAYIEGNVFKNINGNGIRTNRGRENTITNNLFISCTEGGVKVSGPNYDDGATEADFKTNYDNMFNVEGAISAYATNERWIEEFPTLCALMETLAYENWADPAAMVVTKNLSIDCGDEGVSVAAWAAKYEDTFNFRGTDYILNSDVSNNGGNITPAELATFDDDGNKLTDGNAYVAASVSSGDSDYAAVAQNPALATAELAAKAGITGFTPIDFASMRQ